jgi:hypothetical protein
VEVVQAWANYRHVFYATVDPPDPDSTLFPEVATPDLVGIARDQRRKLLAGGLAGRVPANALAETIVSVHVAGAKAMLLTCEVDGVLQVKADTGAVVNDDVTTRLVVANFERSAARWLVAPGEERSHWPGRLERTCIESS